MSSARRKGGDWGLRIGATVALVAVAGFVALLTRAQQLPSGVVPVAWDKEACAHCRMHVGERGFAAQLQLKDQRVLNFDDPGCLMLHLAAQPGEVHAVYLHHHTEERWLSQHEVGFVRVATSPMGFGFGAVDKNAAGASTWDQVVAEVSRARSPTTERAP